LSTETIIFIGVGSYLVIMLGIGIYTSRKTGSTASVYSSQPDGTMTIDSVTARCRPAE